LHGFPCFPFLKPAQISEATSILQSRLLSIGTGTDFSFPSTPNQQKRLFRINFQRIVIKFRNLPPLSSLPLPVTVQLLLWGLEGCVGIQIG